MPNRCILHIDANCFYASVEMLLNPELRGKAVAVCGSTEDRHGIVLARSEKAKKAGVKTGQVNWEARQTCPGLIVVPPHYDQYCKFSRLLRNIYLRYTDLVESYGMDECWLDVTGSERLMGSGEKIAEEIRQSVREELGITASIGVSFLHELCELKLHRYLGDMTAEAVEVQYAEHRDSEFYSDEAETVTDEYVAFCIETIEAVRSSCPDPLIMVEHRLDYSEYVPEGFGTGDLVIVADGVIEVVDFKGGRGVRVDAHRNSQLMLYALGALLEFDPLYDIHHVRMTIVQPRLNNLSSYEMEADELLRWAETEVRPKAMLAYEGKGEFCAGEWCRFCKARYTCRKRSEYHMRLAERDFRQPDLLSDEEIADILPVAESLNSWVQDLMAYATQEAVDGKHWPGYKLVAGRTVRKYTSEAEVIKAATEAGYTDIYKTTLLGVGDLEKRLGRKKFSEVLGKYVVKPQGAPTLVPESDPRKPYSNAASDFSD